MLPDGRRGHPRALPLTDATPAWMPWIARSDFLAPDRRPGVLPTDVARGRDDAVTGRRWWPPLRVTTYVARGSRRDQRVEVKKPSSRSR